MNDKFLNLLGMARGAGRTALGHDMAMESLKKNKVDLLLLAEDTSERLEKEFVNAISAFKSKAEVARTPYSIDIIHKAVGYKAGVVAICDQGFAKELTRLLTIAKEEE